MAQSAQTFGTTPETIRKEFLPGTSPFTAATRPNLESAELQVDKAAAPVLVILRSHNVDPAVVTKADHPEAYLWLQDTVSLGAVVRLIQVGSLGVEADAVTAWREEYERRLEELRSKPESVLPGLVGASAGGAGSVRSHATAGLSRAPTFTLDRDT
jgi:hypothetical protein